jgi:hypothetical protein
MSSELIEKLWQRPQGKCECIKAAHNHPGGKCNKELKREMLANSGDGGWKILQIYTIGGENMNAYVIYCNDCFQKLPDSLKKEAQFGKNI